MLLEEGVAVLPHRLRVHAVDIDWLKVVCNRSPGLLAKDIPAV